MEKIKKLINSLQQFLECDLYSKFKPELDINGEMWFREDMFENEKEFQEYINYHFNILKKEISEVKE